MEEVFLREMAELPFLGVVPFFLIPADIVSAASFRATERRIVDRIRDHVPPPDPVDEVAHQDAEDTLDAEHGVGIPETLGREVAEKDREGLVRAGQKDRDERTGRYLALEVDVARHDRDPTLGNRPGKRSVNRGKALASR